MIGALALRLALGLGGGIVSPQGALEAFLAQRYGRFTLAVLGAGLWAQAVWSMVQAVFDPERKGTSVPGVLERVSFGVSALAYGFLGTAAVKLLLGERLGGEAATDQIVRRILEPPLGRSVVTLFGGILLVAALLQLRFALATRFRHMFALGSMRPFPREAVLWTGRLGYTGLAVLSATIGWFLLRAAWTYDPSQVGGWREALVFVAERGAWAWACSPTASSTCCRSTTAGSDRRRTGHRAGARPQCHPSHDVHSSTQSPSSRKAHASPPPDTRPGWAMRSPRASRTAGQ
jgi:hypothetical protein